MKRMVLVVEDNCDILEDISLLLQFSDYKIINTNNGRSALGLLAENLPDIIISDLCMPGINGLELLQQVRNDKATRDIPFILMTADSTKIDAAKGMKNTKVLIKPFSIEVLLDNIILVQEKADRSSENKFNPY